LAEEEEEEIIQGEDQMIEEGKEGKSSLMEEPDQLVAAIGDLEIDTSAHAKHKKGEQPVQVESIMTSVTSTPAINHDEKEDPQNKGEQP